MKTHFENQKQYLNKNTKNNIAGFSLIEFSIFFVIAAFLTVGILKGNDLIKAYKTQQMIKEYMSFKSIFSQFKAKYNYLPGDFPNAEEYWPGSKNGNGDSIIGPVDPLDWAGGSAYKKYEEGIYAWNHLSNEGLTKGFETAIYAQNCYRDGTNEYLGRQISGSCASYGSNVHTGESVEPGVNIPNGPLKDTGWVLSLHERVDSGYLHWENRVTAGNAASWTSPGYNVMSLLKRQVFNGYYSESTDMQEMTCEHEITIDNKIDDGKPYTGVVLAYQSTCIAGSVADGVTSPGWQDYGFIGDVIKCKSGFPCKPATLPENWRYKSLNQLHNDPDCSSQGYAVCPDSTRFVIDEVYEKYGHQKLH